MNTIFWKLLASEFKRTNACLTLSVAVVATSVACVLTSFSCMSLRDLSGEHLISAKFAERHSFENSEKRDGCDILKTHFDALILPNTRGIKEQKKEPPASDAIAESSADIFSIRNPEVARIIVPVLERRLRWSEENCVVILCGMDRGDAANDEANPETVVMGAALADSLAFSVADNFLLNGEFLNVGAIRPERGDVGDITIWSSLSRAQKLLGMPGKVNGVFAFDCSDVKALSAAARHAFPRSKTLRFSTKAPLKSTATIAINENFNKAMEKLSETHTISRVRLGGELAILCSIATTLLAAWFYLLTFSRTLKNSGETSILLAYGVPSKTIFTLAMLRACFILLLGLSIGTVLSCVAFVFFLYLAGLHPTGETIFRIFDPKLLLWTLSLTSAVVLTAACSASLQKRKALAPELP